MKTRFPLFSMFILCLSFWAVNASAQAQDAGNFTETATDVQKPNLLQRLNLTNPQIRQIRILNRERRPLLQAAQQRLRQANQQLDRAVYADSENEAEIQRLMQEVHAAQREVLRHRIEIERSIRALLTPDQLARFRDLREQFQQNRAASKPVNRNLKNARKPALRRVNQ